MVQGLGKFRVYGSGFRKFRAKVAPRSQYN